MASRTPLPEELRSRAFSVAQARELGVGRGRLRGGDLAVPTRGVRHDGVLSELQWAAQALAVGLPADTAFSHLTAARLLGLPTPSRWRPEESFHVMRPSDLARVRRAGCTAHKGLESRRVLDRRGIRVVSPEDLWCDLASELSLDDLVVLGDAVVHYKRGIPLEQLSAAAERRFGGRGVLRTRAALPHVRPRSNSPMETRTRLLFLRGGLPEPELNVVINDSVRGQWLAESDFVWRERKVVAEFDGDHHRTDRRQWENDIGRRQNLQDDGWVFVQLTARSVSPGPRGHYTVRRLARYLGLPWAQPS